MNKKDKNKLCTIYYELVHLIELKNSIGAERKYALKVLQKDLWNIIGEKELTSHLLKSFNTNAEQFQSNPDETSHGNVDKILQKHMEYSNQIKQAINHLSESDLQEYEKENLNEIIKKLKTDIAEASIYLIGLADNIQKIFDKHSIYKKLLEEKGQKQRGIAQKIADYYGGNFDHNITDINKILNNYDQRGGERSGLWEDMIIALYSTNNEFQPEKFEDFQKEFIKDWANILHKYWPEVSLNEWIEFANECYQMSHMIPPASKKQLIQRNI